jgi:hypothetical protein
MQHETPSEHNRIPLEDIQAAIREGRSLRLAHLYRIVILDDHLKERPLELSEHRPTGRQILEAANVQCVDDYSVYAILPNGSFEDLSFDEAYDIHGHGAERFVIFKTDRAYKFLINDRHLEWGKSHISGWVLKSLADVDPESYGVWLKDPCGEDKLIKNNDFFDLSSPGVEKFFTDLLTITIIVNGRQHHLKQTELSFRGVVSLAFPNAVFSTLTAYTVTFKRGYEGRPEGTMVDGDIVHLKNGEVFNVTATDKS